ncbi:Crp/Fnr family transcriptional regulator [Microvirga sp. GCM10011540]|uniref:Crp/Fnr family transcriptional regulator n=1 Tax=Microvirga sp. GCM10011540 TaxID=3317338 RepID=UPI00361D230A
MMTVAVPPRNKLLASLPAEDFRRLSPKLEAVPLKARRILHHAKLPIEHVYFVEDGLVSVVANTDGDNHGVEAWLIGCEGMAGITVILGAESSPHRRVVQAEGSALRLRTPDLLDAVNEMPALRGILLRYVHGILVQASQSGACNARHSLPQRLARWLLMAQDRLNRSDLPLTHDILSKMLGVRRASVTEAVHVLARADAICAGERGHIHVLDRGKLEGLACGCYFTIRAEFDRFTTPPEAVSSPKAAGERAEQPSAIGLEDVP